MRFSKHIEQEIIQRALEIIKTGEVEGESGIDSIENLTIFLNNKPNFLIGYIQSESIKDYQELEGMTIWLGFNS